MNITKISLATHHYDTPAYITAYLQEPTPNSPWQQFPPLIIVPGGSMTHIPVQEADKTAIAFAARGYQTFILRYTFLSEKQPLYPQPLVDLAQAVNLVRTHQHDWHLADGINILGFPAGGHIAALYNDYWATSWFSQLTGLSTDSLKPHKIVLGYPVIDLNLGFPRDQATIARWTDQPERYSASNHVNDQNVPTFIWHTMDDEFVSVNNAIQYSLALKKHHISQEIHLFSHGPHGMDIANQLVAHHPDGAQPHVAHWVDLASEWLLHY